MKVIQFFLLVLSFSCNNNVSDTQLNELRLRNLRNGNVVSLRGTNYNDTNANACKNEKVEGAIGILVVNENYKFGDTIPVYGQNRKLLTTIKRTDEYQIIALKCVGLTKPYYKVLLDNGSIGLIGRSSRFLKFQTWEEHILSLFSVAFNEISNPLMERPSYSSSKITFDKDEYYHPDKIKGEWLRVKFGSENKWRYGWIKWRDKDKLTIEFFYFA